MKRKPFLFNRREWCLLVVSFMAIIVVFLIAPVFGAERSILSTITSMVGVIGVITISKGSVRSHYIFILYSVLYSILSIITAYYGEAIIYICIMLPIHIYSIKSWKDSLNGSNRDAVSVQQISKRQWTVITVVFVLLTIPFYFLLKALSTDSLIFSTLSLASSCMAAYLMLKRVPYFSLIYALDDILLLLLWGSKLYAGELQYIPTFITCLVMTANDSYSFLCWKIRAAKQKNDKESNYV